MRFLAYAVSNVFLSEPARRRELQRTLVGTLHIAIIFDAGSTVGRLTGGSDVESTRRVMPYPREVNRISPGSLQLCEKCNRQNPVIVVQYHWRCDFCRRRDPAGDGSYVGPIAKRHPNSREVIELRVCWGS